MKTRTKRCPGCRKSMIKLQEGGFYCEKCLVTIQSTREFVNVIEKILSSNRGVK